MNDQSLIVYFGKMSCPEIGFQNNKHLINSCMSCFSNPNSVLENAKSGLTQFKIMPM